MRIIQLTAENVKRLHAIDITPSGNIVQITGRNAQGKSSILDAISMALGGKDACCSQPVRKGEKKAKVVCRLEDLVVTRTFTEDGGGSLSVTNSEGAKYPSPQAVLDKLVGRLTLDPLAFTRLPAKQQAETLKGLVGLDFSALDRERAEKYAERTAVGKQGSTAGALALAATKHADAPAEEVSITDLLAEERRRQKVNADNAELRDDLRQAETDIQAYGKQMKDAAAHEKRLLEDLGNIIVEEEQDLERRIQRLRDESSQRIGAHRSRYDQSVTNCRKAWEHAQEARRLTEINLADARKLVETAVDLDTAEITKQMAEAETTNRKVRENKRQAELADQAEALTKKWLALSDRIKAIDEEKQAALAAASFPVRGLSFDESGVLFNGVPFDQASSAEQLRASVAIGLAMNPKLRVFLVRDGSLLDADSMEILRTMAETYDLQIWCETVANGSNVGIVIEDGRVASVESEALAEATA